MSEFQNEVQEFKTPETKAAQHDRIASTLRRFGLALGLIASGAGIGHAETVKSPVNTHASDSVRPEVKSVDLGTHAAPQTEKQQLKEVSLAHPEHDASTVDIAIEPVLGNPNVPVDPNAAHKVMGTETWSAENK